MTSATAEKRKVPAKSVSSKKAPVVKTTARAAVKTASPKTTPSVPKRLPATSLKTAARRATPTTKTRGKGRTAAADAVAIVRSLAGISTAAVAKATGHGWNYWLLALDKAGAASLPHREIVKVLNSKLGLRTPWWLQMVAVGYEQARGLRKPNQKADGFVASVSRTVAVPINALYAAWQEGKRGDWLPDAIEVRRVTKNKSMKITWPDGSGIDVSFYDKGGNKAVVAIEAAKLPDPGAVAAVKNLWGSTLDRLKATLEGKR